MATDLRPKVDQWYLRGDTGELFRIVALDAASGTIETQDFDGDIAEIDMDSWYELDIEPTSPPEDWSGPFDDLQPEDLTYTTAGIPLQDWRTSLESMRATQERWQDLRTPGELEGTETDRLVDLLALELEADESAE